MRYRDALKLTPGQQVWSKWDRDLCTVIEVTRITSQTVYLHIWHSRNRDMDITHRECLPIREEHHDRSQR